jgi:hypothetical protein
LAGDYKSQKSRKGLTLTQNREYEEMIREGRHRVPEFATHRGIGRTEARKEVAQKLKMDPRAGDKTASTIERDLRSSPKGLASRQKRGGSPERPRLQKIRMK